MNRRQNPMMIQPFAMSAMGLAKVVTVSDPVLVVPGAAARMQHQICLRVSAGCYFSTRMTAKLVTKPKHVYFHYLRGSQ